MAPSRGCGEGEIQQMPETLRESREGTRRKGERALQSGTQLEAGQKESRMHSPKCFKGTKQGRGGQ